MASLRVAILAFCLAAFPSVCAAQVDFAAPDVPVTGHPYSVIQEVTEVTQIYSSSAGKPATQTFQMRFYRDSAGRVRWEAYAPVSEGLKRTDPQIVDIVDPAAHVIYGLCPASRTAWRSLLPQAEPAPAPPSLPPSTNPPDNVDRYIAALRAPETEYLNKTEDLGSKMMLGVQVRGERITRKLRSGGEGTRSAYEVTEVWNAPELDLPVSKRHSSPQTGETIIRTIEIERSEPDPVLFRVPPDYTVQDSRLTECKQD